MNKKEFEQHLNNMYAENFTDDETFENLVYLTVPARGEHVSERTLRKHIRLGKAGSLLKRLDPVAYQCSFNDEKNR